jgi:hypothetical protein
VSRLVEHDLDAAGQSEHDGDAPAFVLGLALHLDAFRPQLTDRGPDVIARQGELVAHSRLVGRPFGGMHPELRGRQGEDEPAVAGVDVLPAEDVAERRAKRVGLRGVEQSVGASDSHG